MMATGGKAIYGASIGILMLDARFPRIPGDMGNAETWPFPVLYKIVNGASPELVVRRGAPSMLEPFIEAGRDLISQGVDGITTNCGFLSVFQQELTDALSVPVLTSSLMQVDLINRLLPGGKRAGILTISGSTLSQDHLQAARVPADTPIGTTEHGAEFTRTILGDIDRMDVEQARRDNVEAAVAMVCDHDDLGAIVLECTNMCPYAADIWRATHIPTYSMVDFVTWFHAGLKPRVFPDP